MSSSAAAPVRQKGQPPPAHPTGLSGSTLALARVGWIAAALLLLGLDVLGTPELLHQLHLACAGNDCLSYQLAPEQLPGFGASGVSLDFYAAYGVALYWMGTLVYAAIAAVIFWRRPDDRMAMFGASTLLIFGAGTVFGALNALPHGNAAWTLPVSVIVNAGPLAFYAFFCLFPSGHFAPTWFRWVALAWLVGDLAALIPYPPLQALTGGTLPFVVFFGLLVVTQVYRYRKVSTPVQRQQTKWVVLGFAAGMSGFLAVLGGVNLLIGPEGSTSPPVIIGFDTALATLLCIIPISIGIAILRSGLWEIDVIIRRTLVYGSLSLLLAAVYFGSVILMQQVARAVTGQQAENNPLVIVLSTLLIAALFTPLRRQLQTAIDRRFYRSRYDAAQTLERFAASLRGEIELAELREHLVGVVEQTMRPAHISLWLRPQDREAHR